MNWLDLCAALHERTFAYDSRLSSLAHEWERELAALWRLEADVNNGAYLQFLSNWGRESYVYASQALKKIGARKMADIVDRCQSLVDEHFDCEGKSGAEMRVLVPNAVIDCEGKATNSPGSVLPEGVVARIYELSHEFMDYPDNIEELGMGYYRAHYPSDVSEIEQRLDAKEKEARTKREATLARLEADLRAAEQVHQEKVKQGTACPKCGFAYAWNGAKCGHCRYHLA